MCTLKNEKINKSPIITFYNSAQCCQYSLVYIAQMIWPEVFGRQLRWHDNYYNELTGDD